MMPSSARITWESFQMLVTQKICHHLQQKSNACSHSLTLYKSYMTTRCLTQHKKDASGTHSVLSLLCNSFLPWTFPCSYLPLVLSELRGDFVHRYKTTVKKRRSVTCPAESGTPTSTTFPVEKTQEVSGPVCQPVFQYANTSPPQWECMTIHRRSYLPPSAIILLVWCRINSWFFF